MIRIVRVIDHIDILLINVFDNANITTGGIFVIAAILVIISLAIRAHILSVLITI